MKRSDTDSQEQSPPKRFHSKSSTNAISTISPSVSAKPKSSLMILSPHSGGYSSHPKISSDQINSSDIMNRVQDFLPRIQQANMSLMKPSISIASNSIDPELVPIDNEDDEDDDIDIGIARSHAMKNPMIQEYHDSDDDEEDEEEDVSDISSVASSDEEDLDEEEEDDEEELGEEEEDDDFDDEETGEPDNYDYEDDEDQDDDTDILFQEPKYVSATSKSTPAFDSLDNSVEMTIGIGLFDAPGMGNADSSSGNLTMPIHVLRKDLDELSTADNEEDLRSLGASSGNLLLGNMNDSFL